jgi:hypothetical protein
MNCSISDANTFPVTPETKKKRKKGERKRNEQERNREIAREKEGG